MKITNIISHPKIIVDHFFLLVYIYNISRVKRKDALELFVFGHEISKI